MARRGAAVLLLVALLAAAAGCGAHYRPAGPPVTEPRLTDSHLLMADGARLPLRRWLPAGPQRVRAVVLALHGFNDYSHAFADAGPAFAAAGVALYAYDQRGFGAAPAHGRWPGHATLAADLATAARLVAAAHPGAPLYLMGESLGGALVMDALGRDTPAAPGMPRPAGAVLLAPAVWGWSTLPVSHRWALEASVFFVPWLRLAGDGLGIRPTDNVPVLRALGRDSLVIKRTRVDALYGLVEAMERAHAAAPHLDDRLLLLYGGRDELIPAYAMQRVLDRLPEAGAARRTVGVYEDGWHLLLRDLQGERVVRDIIAWIGQPDDPLPSGADRRAAACLDTDSSGEESP